MVRSLKSLFVAAMFLVIGACTTIFGVSGAQLDSANKNLAAASIQLTSAARLTTSLVRAGTITPSQAIEVRDTLQTALNAVTTASEAVAASGDPTQADNAIVAAGIAIELALRLLNGFTGQDLSLNTEGIYYEPYSVSARRVSSFKRGAFGTALA